MVCACSSTTAISRFHMIWVWICASAALGRATMKSNLAASERNIAEFVDLRLEQRTDNGRGILLGDHGWTADLCTGREIDAPIDRHILKFAGLRIKQRTPRPCFRFAQPHRHGDRELALRRCADRYYPA